MARMTKREQYRAYVERWRKAGPELEKFHAEELRRYRYNPADADALLELGDSYDGPPRLGSGMVEMQRLFMKAARQQGLLPAEVHETPPAYGSTDPNASQLKPEQTTDQARSSAFTRSGMRVAIGAKDRLKAELRTGDGSQATPSACSLSGRSRLKDISTATMRILGNADILRRRKLALLCSVKCPGKLILDAYDMCQHLRARGVTVVSGFHSPMEQECRRILLRSPHPVIWCLARGMLTRTPPDLQKPVTEGRLLIVTPFPEKVHRATAATSAQCNRVVAEMADAVLVVHAAPGSKTESLGLDLLAGGKSIFTPVTPPMPPSSRRARNPLRGWTWRR